MISQRRIHLGALIINFLFLITLGAFIYLYLATHRDVVGDQKTLSHLLSAALLVTILLALLGSMMIAVGIYYFVKSHEASAYYRKLNMINGVLFIFGGVGISLFITLYLLYND